LNDGVIRNSHGPVLLAVDDVEAVEQDRRLGAVVAGVLVSFGGLAISLKRSSEPNHRIENSPPPSG
jgi:hypothetical protein